MSADSVSSAVTAEPAQPSVQSRTSLTTRVIGFRPFNNADPPALAKIWRTCAPSHRLIQPMTFSLLDQHVFAKLYFDRQGLIVAHLDGEPIGFIHAGFGPNDNGSDLAMQTGAICMLIVRPEHRRSHVASDLLGRAEEYLAGLGAKEVYGGGTPHISPFYLGLYGGSRLPGILEADVHTREFFRHAGYAPAGTRLIQQRELSNFRPPIDRKLLTVRRQTRLEMQWNPIPKNWWEACTLAPFESISGQLFSNSTRELLAEVRGWHMEPLAAHWGTRAVGVVDLFVNPNYRRQGLASYLLGELLRNLKQEGVRLVEIQCAQTDTPVLELATKFGFQVAARGELLRRGL